MKEPFPQLIGGIADLRICLSDSILLSNLNNPYRLSKIETIIGYINTNLMILTLMFPT